MVTAQIDLPLDVIADFCRRRRIARLELFGSVLRDDFGPESDLDFLYTLEPTIAWTFGQTLDAEEELEALLRREVDLISRSSAENIRNPWRRRNILGSARDIYPV
jgi:predicted nucleotidyltransferase